MHRKRAVAYIRVTLSDDVDALVRKLEAWCKRMRIVLVEAITVEAAQAQPRLQRLLSSIGSRSQVDLVVSPSAFHFSPPAKLLSRLAVLQYSGIGVAFAQEGILLHGSSAQAKAVYSLAAAHVESEKVARSQAIKQSLRIAALYGRTFSKPRIPESVRREAAMHLRAGRSLRDTAKMMRGKISRSTLWALRKELRNQNGEK